MVYNEENPHCFVCGKPIPEEKRPCILVWNDSHEWMEAICDKCMGVKLSSKQY